MLGVNGEGRSVVVAHFICRLDSRASPLVSRLGHWGLTCRSSMGWRRGSVVWLWGWTVIDHDDLLGDAILVEFAPVGLFPSVSL